MVEYPMDGFDSQLLKEIEDHDNNEKFDSSSETEIDEYIMLHSTRKNHPFGRQKPLHLVLGGEKRKNQPCLHPFLVSSSPRS